MIRPPASSGVAFSDGSDGDLRNDADARSAFSAGLDISNRWATVRQVHGNGVIRAGQPGQFGDADGLWTTTPGLPLAVFTADCFGVVVKSRNAVGVAHAGWRGAKAGVVSRLIDAMSRGGHPPHAAAVGPGIRACCFEVGMDVASQFDGFHAETTWGTRSVDLDAVLGTQLAALEVWDLRACTLHEEGWFSHRRDRTTHRMATVGWLD